MVGTLIKTNFITNKVKITFLSSADWSSNLVFKQIFQEYIAVSSSLHPEQGPEWLN